MLSLVVAAVLIGAVAVTNLQQVSAPRSCGSCEAYTKLTHESEKNVTDVATVADSYITPGLLEKYVNDVRALDFIR